VIVFISDSFHSQYVRVSDGPFGWEDIVRISDTKSFYSHETFSSCLSSGDYKIAGKVTCPKWV
jgi:hypothetical protein